MWRKVFLVWNLFSDVEMALFSPRDAENMIRVYFSMRAVGELWNSHKNHIFSIKRRKVSHFRSEIQISCHKCFLKHENSTISVERNFFSQLTRFRAFLSRRNPKQFLSLSVLFFHKWKKKYFSFTCERKNTFLSRVKEK